MTNKFDIFISYSRADLERVKAIKAELEHSTGALCWMDLEGIESGEQFENVIISAINRSDTMLFMLSESSMRSEWALDELDLAKKKRKRIVIVHLEEVELSDKFYFRYHKYDQIKWQIMPQHDKLIRDICLWTSKMTHENETKQNVDKIGESESKAFELQLDIDGKGKGKENFSKGFKNSTTQFLVTIKQSGLRWAALAVLTFVVIIPFFIFLHKEKTNDKLTNDTLPSDSLMAIPSDTMQFAESNEKIENNHIPSDFILVPGGHFSFKGNYYEDYKIHSIDIDSFYICRYELTQGEYKRVMNVISKENYSWLVNYERYADERPKYVEFKNDSIPVRGSYKDFVEYCNARSIKEGYDGFYIINNNTIEINELGNGYRLVTPYEWIFAAYGGNLNKKERYLGGKSLSEVAWHQGNSNNKPHPVGLKKPNIIGIYDMQGNAPELLQGDKKRKHYKSMMGRYDVSDWNYPQTYDPTYICTTDEEDIAEWCCGTRIALVTKYMKNRNLSIIYNY